MKKKKRQQDQNHQHVQEKLEILKTVAQAWLNHTEAASSRPTGTEFDLRRINFHPKPSRFKLEDIKKAAKESARNSWDFQESLLDTYEIVAVSKKLERGLVLDYEWFFDDGDLVDGKRQVVRRRRRESSHSLRKLFNKLS